MSRGGKRLFPDLDFRGDALPPRKRAVAPPLPRSEGDRAHLSRKLISEASRVLDADELEEFESVIRGVQA